MMAIGHVAEVGIMHVSTDWQHVACQSVCIYSIMLYTSLGRTCITSRVNNKEGKRVSNALYTLYIQDVFGKSRARNSKIDQSERSIQMVRCGRGLECKLKRARFRPKARADHNIKQAFMKNLA